MRSFMNRSGGPNFEKQMSGAGFTWLFFSMAGYDVTCSWWDCFVILKTRNYQQGVDQIGTGESANVCGAGWDGSGYTCVDRYCPEDE